MIDSITKAILRLNLTLVVVDTILDQHIEKRTAIIYMSDSFSSPSSSKWSRLPTSQFAVAFSTSGVTWAANQCSHMPKNCFVHIVRYH